MTTLLSRAEWPAGVEEARAALEIDPLDADAASQLRAALGPVWVPDAALDTLVEVCGLLDGGPRWPDADPSTAPPPALDPGLYDALVIHPREKEERRHRFASLVSRVLHLLEGDPTARTVAAVTEKAAPAAFPRFCRLVEECAGWSRVQPSPAARVARGEEKPFTVLVDDAPFLYVHLAYIDEAPGGNPLPPPQLRFAVARLLQHVRGGHAALMQLSAERLETMVLNEVPFVFRVPVKVATKAVRWMRVRSAVKWVGGWFRPKSRTHRVVDTVGEMLPDRDQETVLPQMVHDWLWSWVEGVEFSADRAGLLACGNPAVACTAALSVERAWAERLPEARQRGLRRLIAEHGESDCLTADRLRELLRFALSEGYLAHARERATILCAK
jgi:hypothetical protein